MIEKNGIPQNTMPWIQMIQWDKYDLEEAGQKIPKQNFADKNEGL